MAGQVLRALIDETLQTQEAKKNNVNVADKDVEGVSFLGKRENDWESNDKIWGYIPSTRRVRKINSATRSDPIAEDVKNPFLSPNFRNLTAPGVMTPLGAVPVFMESSRHDEWVALDDVAATAKAFEAAGARVELQVSDEREHRIRDAAVAGLRALL